MVGGDRGLNQRLIEPPLGRRALLPQVFPHLVGVEVLPAIEQLDAGQVSRSGESGVSGDVGHRVYRKKRPLREIENRSGRRLHDTRFPDTQRYPPCSSPRRNARCRRWWTWCRTLHHSLSAGPRPGADLQAAGEVRPAGAARVAGDLAAKLAAGESLEDAFEPHRDRFPPLFLELVAVGEQTGRLEDTFRELDEYYSSRS